MPQRRGPVDWFVIITVTAIVITLSVLSIKACTDCTARGGAFIEPRNGLPFCLEQGAR